VVLQNHEEEKNSKEFFVDPAPQGGGGAEDASALPVLDVLHGQGNR